MNGLKSIIARRVYMCVCGGAGRYSRQREREGEKESFDLSERIWHAGVETVVVTVGTRREMPSAGLVDRKSPFFILHPFRPLLALRSL